MKEENKIEVNLSKVKAVVEFGGKELEFTDYNKYIANLMKYGNNQIFDIGWDECARRLYMTEGEVEIECDYLNDIIDIVKKDTQMCKGLKLAIIDLLTLK